MRSPVRLAKPDLKVSLIDLLYEKKAKPDLKVSLIDLLYEKKNCLFVEKIWLIRHAIKDISSIIRALIG